VFWFIAREVIILLESQLALLNDKISQLEAEISRLKSEKRKTKEQIIEVPPSDYNSLKKEIATSSRQNQFLQSRCCALEHLLLFNDGSPSEHIIQDFKAISQLYLLHLAKEVEIYRFCAEERANLIDFLDYLHSVTQEIEDMIFVER
jgi:ribonuclease HIII